MGRNTALFFVLAGLVGLASGCGDQNFDPEATQNEEIAEEDNRGEVQSALYTRQQMVDIVMWNSYSQGGDPYVFGAAGPDAWDCSGLTMWVMSTVGVSLPHYSASQWNYGYHWTDDADIWPADLVFFGAPGISHVGIYVGDGNYIHAPAPGGVVKLSALSAASKPYYGHARYF